VGKDAAGRGKHGGEKGVSSSLEGKEGVVKAFTSERAPRGGFSLIPAWKRNCKNASKRREVDCQTNVRGCP